MVPGPALDHAAARHTYRTTAFSQRSRCTLEDVYRVFEALDELVAIVEEARGLPPTRTCIVPRGDVLDLLDDVREAFPGELDDAQDVLDHRDKLVADARETAETTVSTAAAQARAAVDQARDEADRILSDAKAHADRMVAEAGTHADTVVARAQAEADRLVEAGRASYERAVADGMAERDRLVGNTEVVQASKIEAARVIDTAHAESDDTRAECDVYVDTKLADFEELLDATLRAVGRGRQQLRTGAGVPDYHSDSSRR